MLDLTSLVGFGAGGGDAHKHWRIFLPAYTTYGSATEIEMRATSGSIDQCSGGIVTASSYDGSQTPAKAFDNDTSQPSSWLASSSGPDEWIAYEFTQPVVVGEITYKPYYFGSILYGRPSARLQFSDDGVGWTTAKEWTGLAWTAGETKTLTV